MKKGIKRDIATSFTTLLFLIIGISGIMMFFHFYDGLVKELHEILGLVFMLAVLFHVAFNWSSMKNYFSKKIFISVSAIVALISAIFISQSLNQGENPKGIVFNKVFNAPLTTSFKLLNGNYENAIKKLKEQNINLISSNNIESIAKANNTSPFRIISIITTK